MKLLSVHLCGLWWWILSSDSESTVNKRKKIDTKFIKLKNVYSSKDIIKKMKRQPTE